MVVIWATKCVPEKVKKNIREVLRPHHHVEVLSTCTVPEGTTVILALGADPLKVLQTQKVLAKNRTITSARTQPLMLGTVPVLVSYSPEIGEIDHGYHVDLLTDVSLALRYYDTGQWMPVYGQYRYVLDFAELCAAIEAEHTLTQEPVDVSVDLETLGFDPYALPTLNPPYPGAYIVSIQATHQNGKADVVRFADRMHERQRLSDPVFRAQMEFLLHCPYIRLKGANFKYDMGWLWARGAFTCSTFTFDTTIVGSLLDENRCVAPESRLLTGDLKWVPAKSVQVGDELLAFDEHCSKDPGKGRYNLRQLRTSVVEAVASLQKRCYRLTLESGRSIVVSDNHQFLVDEANSAAAWKATEHLSVGDVVRVFPFAEEDRSYDAGWMAGFLDGEGWLTTQTQKDGQRYFRMGVAQRKNSAFERVKQLFASWGIDFYVSLSNYYQKKDGNQAECWSIGLKGGGAFALLQRTRPERLLGKRCWLDTPIPTVRDAVVKKELVGLTEVLAITTTTHTFIAEGMCSHNSNSLDVHVKIYVPALAGYADAFNHSVNKNRMDQVPPATLLPYAGGDVDGDLQVAAVMKQELLKDQRLTRFYVNILHPASRAFEQIEQGGILVDKVAYQELRADLEAEHTRLVKDAIKIMGGRIFAKHGDLSKPGGMNLTKASMLSDFMFTMMGLNLKPKMWTEKPDKDGIKRPATSMEHLEMFSDEPKAKDFIALIREDSSCMKTYNTYVIGFLEHLRSDGRFHPNFFLYKGNQDEGEGGATTGRLSCKRPAFQTVPKFTKWAPRIRRCFPAPPGYVIGERDYGQGELRVIACIANETAMLAVFQSGRDIHAETAAPFAGYTYESLMALEQMDFTKFEATRQLGKAGNFGLVFGMHEEGFVNYARSNYGVELTMEQAKEFRDAYFKKYSKLYGYHDYSIEFAKRHKHVRTPLGRIRHLPLIKSPNREIAAKAERQAINCVDQQTEMLTQVGWKLWQDVNVGELAYSMNPVTSRLELVPVEAVHHGEYSGVMHQWNALSFSAMATPSHRWLVTRQHGRNKQDRWEFQQSVNLKDGPFMKIPLAAKVDQTEVKLTDDELRCVGWLVTDGHFPKGLKVHYSNGERWNTTKVCLTQKKPEMQKEIERLLMRLGYSFGKDEHPSIAGSYTYTWSGHHGQKYRNLLPCKKLTPQFVSLLSARQLQVLLDVMLMGDGWSEGSHTCLSAGAAPDVADVWAMVGVLAGYAVTIAYRPPSENQRVYESIGYKIANHGDWIVRLKKRKFAHSQYGHHVISEWLGTVWCPTMKYGNFVARREGSTFITGNSPVQGTLTDMVLWTLALEHQAGLHSIAPCFGCCHDSVLNYVPEDRVDEIVTRQLDTMEHLPFEQVDWYPQLKFVADAKVGKNWGQMKKYQRKT